MTLQYFRRHRKYLMVLMLLAVFAMVTFGALYYAPEAWTKVEGWVTGETPDNPTVLIVYGQRIHHRERVEVATNLDVAYRLMVLGQQESQHAARRARQLQSKEPLSPKEKEELAALQHQNLKGMILSYSVRQFFMLDRFLGAADKEEVDRVIDATVVLLREARRAGIHISDDMIREQFLAPWQSNEVVGPQGLFRGNEPWLLAALRQELMLRTYLVAVAENALVVREDIWDMYRRQNQKATVQTAEIRSSLFLKDVPQPTDEQQILTQFNNYKDDLPDSPDSPFGYMTPARIAFQWLEVDAKVVEAGLTVTEDEIEDYYEKNKDKLYVKPKAAKKPEEPGAEKPAEQPVAEPDAEKPAEGAAPLPSDAEPKSDVDQEPAPDEAQPAKTLDAPEGEEAAAEPESQPAADKPAADQAETTETAGEPKSEAAPPAEPTGAETPKEPGPQVPVALPGQTTTETPAEQPKEEPKEYKSLDEVRDQVRKKLMEQKVSEKAQQLAEDALQALQSNSRISMANVATDKSMKLYNSKGLQTADEIKRIPGIGGARDFTTVAFSVEGLADKPLVALNVVADQVLSDSRNNRYLFKVTEMKKAEVPASINLVRARVIADLRKVEAYRAAERAAQDVITKAYATNLSIVGMQETVGGQKLNVRSRDLKRSAAGSDDPLAQAVFEAVDDGKRFNTVGSDDYSKVTVFEVGQVTLTTKAEYEKDRDRFVRMAAGTARANFIDEFTDPQEIIRRSDLKVVKPKAQAEAPAAEADEDAGDF